MHKPVEQMPNEVPAAPRFTKLKTLVLQYRRLLAIQRNQPADTPRFKRELLDCQVRLAETQIARAAAEWLSDREGPS